MVSKGILSDLGSSKQQQQQQNNTFLELLDVYLLHHFKQLHHKMCGSDVFLWVYNT